MHICMYEVLPSRVPVDFTQPPAIGLVASVMAVLAPIKTAVLGLGYAILEPL